MKGKTIMIIGPVGQGKTMGMYFADPTKTIAIVKKELPWIGWEEKYKEGKNLHTINSPKDLIIRLKKIIELKKTTGTKLELVVIDDISIIAADEMNARAKESGWDKYNDLGLFFDNLMNLVKVLNKLEVTIIITGHPSFVEAANGSTIVSLETYSPFANKTVNIPGKVTAIFHTHIEEGYEPTEAELKYETLDPEFRFIVNKRPDYKTVRSPYGLFNGDSIPNNYKLIMDVLKSKYK